jgi:hypothetical protein
LVAVGVAVEVEVGGGGDFTGTPGDFRFFKGGDKMWPWYGFRHPWGFPYGYGYPYGGYPWAMPKEEEIKMLEDQERWLTSELDGVRKRLEELRK